MGSNPPYSLIKRVETSLPRGAPFDLDALRRLDVSAHLAARYVRSGWLVRLGQGVYAFSGDELTVQGSVRLLQGWVAGLHVGGRTALALQGVRHNVGGRQRLVLWGDERFALPAWFTARHPARYACARLFDWPAAEAGLRESTLTVPAGTDGGPLVATPERASLEMLYDVGTHQGLEEARNLFDGLRNVRTGVAGRLLACCTSVKAVRLFLTWAGETGLVDVEALRREFRLRVGSDRRWMSRLKDGTLLTLRPYG